MGQPLDHRIYGRRRIATFKLLECQIPETISAACSHLRGGFMRFA
jgi:hypothetical protein